MYARIAVGHFELSEKTIPTALVTALMFAAATVTAAESQRHVHLCGHGIEIAARGNDNCLPLTTNPPSNCANSFIVPPKFRFAMCREDSGCPSNGSKINGLSDR
jgi:hypothetical protein